MTDKKELDLAIIDLRNLHAETTEGEWQKGETTHETVVKQGKGKSYHIASFHHAADAAFIDVAHKYMIPLLDEIDALRKKVLVLEG
jgi:hypothetical protein